MIQKNIMMVNTQTINSHFNSIKERREIYQNRLESIVHPLMEEIRFPKIDKVRLGFSVPIDPQMARARASSIVVCPFFVLELEEIPLELRPIDGNDPRLCELVFLQKLSDWAANEFGISKQKVTFIEAAAIKAIIKLKQDPEGMKALRAGLVHEIGHIALGHCWSSKGSKEVEKEADLYVIKHLKNGLEGMKIGFSAWQRSLQEVRKSSQFSWKDRILMHLVITPGGNLLPHYFTHGFFETRIRQAEQLKKLMDKSWSVTNAGSSRLSPSL